VAENNAANRRKLLDCRKRRIIGRYTPSKMANHPDNDLTGFQPISLSRLKARRAVAKPEAAAPA
jgi:hypothetical protein